ncbi:MAG TPA: DUF3006 domain-containing protein [Syntrophomonadaceae bacterium]|jgi:hypothetical protein|nr:DUF3006 domain-containing protein [Syntrophomonadaceae bacterium]
MKCAIIDRFEGRWAIVEIDGEMKSIRRQLIPPEAREGDVLVLVRRRWQVDREATAKLRQEVERLADEVWE